jgi:hypothetical protein
MHSVAIRLVGAEDGWHGLGGVFEVVHVVQFVSAGEMNGANGNKWPSA